MLRAYARESSSDGTSSLATTTTTAHWRRTEVEPVAEPDLESSLVLVDAEDALSLGLQGRADAGGSHRHLADANPGRVEERVRDRSRDVLHYVIACPGHLDLGVGDYDRGHVPGACP